MTLCNITGRVSSIALNGVLVLVFLMLQKGDFVTVTKKKKNVSFTEKKKPNAGVTFLCTYGCDTSTGGNCAMHEPVECFLLSTGIPFAPQTSDRLKD